uniref:Uncharacterized protein n=1 Tax=Glossina palpalis gambiensis TaxID=67801 RepID=A0A1B0AYW8_9MUSC
MGAHSSKEKLTRSYSERFIHSQSIERERFGSFGKRTKGAAKKRDVRNLSISPTDLGPPPKTQQTANEKRYGSSGQTAATQSSTSTTISSPTSGNSVISVKSATASNQKFMTASPATGKLPLKVGVMPQDRSFVHPQHVQLHCYSDASDVVVELMYFVSQCAQVAHFASVACIAHVVYIACIVHIAHVAVHVAYVARVAYFARVVYTACVAHHIVHAVHAVRVHNCGNSEFETAVRGRSENLQRCSRRAQLTKYCIPSFNHQKRILKNVLNIISGLGCMARLDDIGLENEPFLSS